MIIAPDKLAIAVFVLSVVVAIVLLLTLCFILSLRSLKDDFSSLETHLKEERKEFFKELSDISAYVTQTSDSIQTTVRKITDSRTPPTHTNIPEQ